MYLTLTPRLTQSNLRKILLGNYFKIRYFLGNYQVKHIPQMHILNFNHKYFTKPHSHVTAAVLPCCRHCCHAATTAAMLPRCCYHAANAATLSLPPRCRCRHHVAAKLPPPPLPPRCPHRHRRQQATTATAKLPPPWLSTL